MQGEGNCNGAGQAGAVVADGQAQRIVSRGKREQHGERQAILIRLGELPDQEPWAEAEEAAEAEGASVSVVAEAAVAR